MLDFHLRTLDTLGHCRFPLYIPQKIGNLDTWDVTYGPVIRTLHPGIPPVSIDMIPDIPKVFATGELFCENIFCYIQTITFSSDKIGPGSTVSLTIKFLSMLLYFFCIALLILVSLLASRFSIDSIDIFRSF